MESAITLFSPLLRKLAFAAFLLPVTAGAQALDTLMAVRDSNHISRMTLIQPGDFYSAVNGTEAPLSAAFLQKALERA